MEEINAAWYTPDQTVADKANIKDISWVMTRTCIYGSDSKAVPAWTGFNQVTALDDTQLCTTGYMPLINAPAHENDTLWTVLMRCIRVSNIMNSGQSTVITLGQHSCIARPKNSNGLTHCKTLFVRLVSFHIAKNFMQTIGQHFMDSGLQEVWTESTGFGENTACNNMQAKSYNRAIHAHKLTLEALWKIVWPKIIALAEDKQLNEEELKSSAVDVVHSLENHEDTEVTLGKVTHLEEVIEGNNRQQYTVAAR